MQVALIFWLASRLTPNQLKEAILKIKWLADHLPVIAGQGLRLLKKGQSASEIVNEIVSTANSIASSNLIKDLSCPKSEAYAYADIVGMHSSSFLDSISILK